MMAGFFLWAWWAVDATVIAELTGIASLTAEISLVTAWADTFPYYWMTGLTVVARVPVCARCSKTARRGPAPFQENANVKNNENGKFVTIIFAVSKPLLKCNSENSSATPQTDTQ